MPLLEQIARALDNVNTPEEPRGRAPAARDGAARMKSIEVQYYAMLRDQAGRRAERSKRVPRTAAELFDELAARHRFALARDACGSRSTPSSATGSTAPAGDPVVFIPPVAGG